jgi:hypothetical protein
VADGIEVPALFTTMYIHSAPQDAALRQCVGSGLWVVSGTIGPGLCTTLQMDFYERVLFVKPTWRPRYVVNATALCPSRYASMRTVSESSLFGDSVHRMRSIFSS